MRRLVMLVSSLGLLANCAYETQSSHQSANPSSTPLEIPDLPVNWQKGLTYCDTQEVIDSGYVLQVEFDGNSVAAAQLSKVSIAGLEDIAIQYNQARSSQGNPEYFENVTDERITEVRVSRAESQILSAKVKDQTAGGPLSEYTLICREPNLVDPDDQSDPEDDQISIDPLRSLEFTFHFPKGEQSRCPANYRERGGAGDSLGNIWLNCETDVKLSAIRPSSKPDFFLVDLVQPQDLAKCPESTLQIKKTQPPICVVELDLSSSTPGNPGTTPGYPGVR